MNKILLLRGGQSPTWPSSIRLWIASLTLAMTVFSFHARAQEQQAAPPPERQLPPHLSLIAPFEYSGGEEKSLDLMGVQSSVPSVEVSLEKAHRTTKEIGEWVMRNTSDLLTFKDPDYKTQLQQRRVFFSQSGFDQYLEFIKDHMGPLFEEKTVTADMVRLARLKPHLTFETQKPARRGFATLSQSREDLVRVDSWVFTYHQFRGIHE